MAKGVVPLASALLGVLTTMSAVLFWGQSYLMVVAATIIFGFVLLFWPR